MQFYAPGKLILSGEYAVLNGAIALAIPTAGYGQTLSVNPFEKDEILWESFEPGGKWFEVIFSPDLQQIIKTTNQSQAVVIQQLLSFIKKQKPQLFDKSLHFVTKLTFNRQWGFGSSSSLIALLSKWSRIPVFDLLDISFGGSGYDVAVAMENKAILYQLTEPDASKQPVFRGKQPVWQSIDYNPPFADDVYLIYRNIKQNSRNEIKKYIQKPADNKQITAISRISEALINCYHPEEFEALITEHERIISQILQRPTVQDEFFTDYPGKIKSLGAWGGDFILATRRDAPSYFKPKGFHTIINLKDLLT